MQVRRLTWWLVVAALASGFLLGGATAKDNTLFGPTVAAWLQAIGGIVAIVASASIAIMVDRNAANRARTDRETGEAKDTEDGRNAVSTAIAMLSLIEAQAERTKRANGGINGQYVEDWKRRARIASQQLSFHIERARIPADLAFAAIYVREEVVEVRATLDMRADWKRSDAELVAAMTAAVGRSKDILEEYDSGILRL